MDLQEELIEEAHKLIEKHDEISFRAIIILKKLKDLPQTRNVKNIIEELKYCTDIVI